MPDISELVEMISDKLRCKEHRELLEALVDAFINEDSENLEEKIKEILSEIEEA